MKDNEAVELGDEGKWWRREVVTKGSGDWRREVVTKGSGEEGKWWWREVVMKGSGEEGRWGRGSSMRFLKLCLQIAM